MGRMMAGLLDFFGGSPSSQGLLAGSAALMNSGGPSRMPVSFGQGMSQALGAGQQAYQQAQEFAMQKQLRDMQLQALKAKTDEDQRQRTHAEEMRDLARQFSVTPQAATARSMGPTMDGGVVPQVSPGFDYAGFADALAVHNPTAALEMKQKLRKEAPEFSTEPRYDQNGRAFILSKDGSVKYLDGVKARDRLISEDLGGKKVFRTEYSPAATGAMEKTQSPDSKASNSLGWANHNLSKQRLSLDQSDPKLAWNSDLNAFVNPRTRQILPALDGQGKPTSVIPSGKMTEDQGKASVWLVQAGNAYKNMIAAIDPKTGTPSAARPGFNDALAAIPSMGATGAIANTMRGTDRQKFLQASSSLSEALLRVATGAGINIHEAEQKIRELTPVFGEAAATTKQKMESIPVYIEALKARAGPVGAAKAMAVLQSSGGGATGSFATESDDPLGLFKK